MEKKYELTNETIDVGSKILHRIRALKDFGNVKKGDLGGFIEKENNLSHEGDCWVGDNAYVLHKAQVCGNACIDGFARVYNNAKVFGKASVGSISNIYENTRVFDSAFISRKAKIYNSSLISIRAKVGGMLKSVVMHLFRETLRSSRMKSSQQVRSNHV